MKTKKKSYIRFYLFLFITLLLMGMIFFFSAQPSNVSEESSGFLVELIEKALGRPFSGRTLETIVFLVRKTAHFSEYLLVGLFFSLTLNEKRTFHGKEFAFSVLICSLYAVSDEIHQHFVPGRSGELRDVCIDAAGAFLGCFLVFSFTGRKNHES